MKKLLQTIMRWRYLSSLVAVIIALSVSNYASASIVGSDDRSDEEPGINPGENTETSASQSYTGEIWRIADEELEETLSMLQENGGEVLYHRDDLYLVMYPVSTRMKGVGSRVLRAPGKTRNLKRYAPTPRAIPLMDVARTFQNAPDIYTGTGLPQPFDGTGVVAGFSDIGFDTRHANFLNADGSASRIKMFGVHNIMEGYKHHLYDAEEIYDYWSDNGSESHATHVAGIMAGRGTPSPYVGMAPGADIAASTSNLTDVGILSGVEDIIAYAKSVDKPCVINLSIGNYTGPHDGTSLFCQYLDKCADDAIICISSGNTGQKYGHISYTFKGEDDSVKFRFYDEAWAYKNILGMTDVYSSDSKPIRMKIFLADTTVGGNPEVFTTEEIDFSKTPVYIITADKAADDGENEYHYYEDFAKYFSGEVYLEGSVDPENGRYYVSVWLDAYTDILVSDTKKWGRYQMGGYVMADPGVHVDMFADCQYTSFKTTGVTYFPDTRFSTSNMATGKRVISVGAYYTQPSVPLLNGKTWAGGEPGSIAPFSSYAVLNDGRVTPLTIAPGGPIISSYNGKYVKEYGTEYCSYENGGDYWGANSGTSMAAPYVAGCIATWLQANPMLTTEDVMEIVKESNTYATPTNTLMSTESDDADERKANGFFNPYVGLKMVVDKLYSDVQTIAGKSLFATYGNDCLMINNPDMRDVTISVYSIAGHKLAEVKAGTDAVISVGKDKLGLNGAGGLAICKVSAPGAQADALKIKF